MATVLRLPDLLDLALPDEEKVNPAVLNVALQSLTQLLALKDAKIEFRGSESDKIQSVLASLPSEKLRNIPITKIPSTELKDLPNHSAQSLNEDRSESSSLDGQKRKYDSNEDVVIVKEGQVFPASKRPTIGVSTFARLDNKVKTLQVQLEALAAQVLPADDALLEATRTNQESTPILDLFQGMNITKRMSGAEEGIDKLASMLETIAKEYATLKTVIDKVQDEMGEDVVDIMKQIKLAANYAKQIRPREMMTAHGGIVRKKDAVSQARSRGELPIREGEKSREREITMREGEKSRERGIPITEGEKAREREIPTREEEKAREREIPRESLDIVKEAHQVSEMKEKEMPWAETQSMYDPYEETKGLVPKKMHLAEIRAEGMTDDGHIEKPSDSRTLDVIEPIQEGEEVRREKINQILAQHEYMRNNIEYLTAQVNTLADFADKVMPELLGGLPHVAELKRRVAAMAGRQDSQHSMGSVDASTKSMKLRDGPAGERIREMEAKVVKHEAKLKRQDFMICEKMMEYDQRINSVTAAIDDILDLFVQQKKKIKLQRDEEMQEIADKIKSVEDAMVDIGYTTQALNEDQRQKNAVLESLGAELDLIKTVKADRYEVEDIFADKADCKTVQEKVDNERFETVISDLARGIDEALGKIAGQETTLSATMQEIQSNATSKIDQNELETVLRGINQEILDLKEKFQQLSDMKEGRVAAGAKQQFITDVNCLSCDRNVSMRTTTGAPCIPALADLPATKSLRPFIAYEMDYLRKMRIKDPQAQRYINYNELAQRYDIRSLDSYDNLQNVPHLKSRYCGGSHTTIGPLQKVTHTGHFNVPEDPYHQL